MSGQIQDTNDLDASFNETIVRLREAYEERDPEKITDLFAEETVASIGGREKFANYVVLGESAANATKAKFGEPGKPQNLDGRWFSLIEFQMESRPVGEKWTKHIKTCLIAVSSDEGKTWNLHTGESFYTTFPKIQGRFEIIIRSETIVEN